MTTKPLRASAPRLVRLHCDDIAYWTDPDMRDEGVLVAFAERTGGCSAPPFASLDLAGHVGDDPERVDANRAALLRAVGIGELCGRLVTAEQVHGDDVTIVTDRDAGRGAQAEDGRPSVPATDALVTVTARLPLMLFFADCVPIVLVVPGPSCVAVVHAGWRGALAGIPGKAVAAVCRVSGAMPVDVRAYVGAHIGGCCYEVGDPIVSQFVHTFGTVARAESGNLDLGGAVSASLTGAGVRPSSVCRLDLCTAEATDRFFSYRAEGGHTGRHAALACIVEPSR